MVSIEHIQVETRVHALARPAGAERTTAAHERVDHTTGHEVFLVQERRTLEADDEMRELGHLIVRALIQIGQVLLHKLVAAAPLGLARVYVTRARRLPHGRRRRAARAAESTLDHRHELGMVHADAGEHGARGLVESVHERVEIVARDSRDIVGRANFRVGQWRLAERRLVQHLH